MRVAVTGATGFIGRHLVERLATAGHDVIPIRLSGRLCAPDVDTFRRLLAPAVAADVIVNLAAALRPRRPVEVFVTAEAPAVLARLCAEAGGGRLIHVSTANVGVAGLDDPYTRAKRRAEAALAGLPARILRPGLVWSWRGEGNAALFDRYFRLPLPVHPAPRPGNRYRPVPVEELAAFLADEAADGPAGGTLTVLGDTPCTLWDLAQGYARLHGRRALPVPLGWLRRVAPARLLAGHELLSQALETDRAGAAGGPDCRLLPFRWPDAGRAS